jgi:chromosome segregation ATPase
MLDGDKFPAIIVFNDGEKNYVAEGYTRCAAAKQAGLEIIDADVQMGTFEDAFDYAFTTANHGNGQRYKPNDKRRAITKAFTRDRYLKKSDREISRICKVANSFVSKIRKAAGMQPDVIEVTRGKQTYEISNPKKEAINEPAPTPEKDYIFDELSSAVQELAEENKALEARVAVVAMEATDEEKQAAAALIAELQAEIKTLEADNRVLKASRDSFQLEASEAKTQALYGKRRYEKAEKEIVLLQRELAVWKDRAQTAEAHLEIDKAA